MGAHFIFSLFLWQQASRPEAEEGGGGCRLTLGTSSPPGMPRDGADARVPLQGQGLERWKRHGGAGSPAFSSKWGTQRRLPRPVFYEYLIIWPMAAAHLLKSAGSRPWSSRTPRRRRCLPSDEPPWGTGVGRGFSCIRVETVQEMKGCPVRCAATGFLLPKCKMGQA